MKTFNIEMNKDLVSYIERLYFEVMAKERIVKTMLADDSYENLMENENFINYQKKYEQAYAEYSVAQQEITNSIPEHLRRKHRISWNLIFLTNVLEITFECNCFDKVDSIVEVFTNEKD